MNFTPDTMLLDDELFLNSLKIPDIVFQPFDAGMFFSFLSI